jgi:hypothetical protein
MQRLDGSTTLPTGLRLRLRMPIRHDAARLRALLERLGVEADDLALSRMLHFDPRTRAAIVATALIARSEEIVGFAAMDHAAARCELVLADEAQAPGTGALLRETLLAHRERIRRIA